MFPLTKKSKNRRSILKYYKSDYFLNFPDSIFNIGLYGTSTKLSPQKSFVDLLAKKINLVSVDELLDIGCGAGKAGEFLAESYGCKVTGLTISKKQVADSKKIIKNENVTIKLGDAHQMPFSDNQFNKAICLEAAFHFFDKQKFCNEAYRVLKPGSKMAIADLTMNSQSEVLHPELMRCISVDKWRSLLKQAGFRLVEEVSLGKQTFAPALKYFSERGDLKEKFRMRHDALIKATKIMLSNYRKGESDYTLFVVEKQAK